MPLPQPPHVTLTLRIRKDLHDKIMQAAKRQATTVVTQIRIRLEDSFVAAAHRALEEIVADLQVTYARLGHERLLNRLEDDLAQAIARSNDLQEIKTIASAWLGTRRVSPDSLKGFTS